MSTGDQKSLQNDQQGGLDSDDGMFSKQPVLDELYFTNFDEKSGGSSQPNVSVSEATNKYIEENSLATMYGDLASDWFGLSFLARFAAHMEAGHGSLMIVNLKTLIQQAKDVLAYVEEYVDVSETGTVTTTREKLPKDVDVNFAISAKLNQGSLIQDLHILGYTPSGEQSYQMESPVVSLIPTKRMDCLPKLMCKDKTEKEYPGVRASLISAFHYINAGTHAGTQIGKVTSRRPDMFAGYVKCMQRVAKTGFVNYKFLDDIAKETIEEVRKHYSHDKFNYALLPTIKPSATMEKFFSSDSMEAVLKAILKGYNDMRDEDVLQALDLNVDYTPKDLEDDRKYRAFGRLEDVAKEPEDLVSLKFNGLSVIKKWVRPILENLSRYTHASSFGHSETNNWEILLNCVGVAIESGQDINSFELSSLGKRQNILDLPGGPKGIFDGVDDEIFVKLYVNLHKAGMPQEERGLVISDIHSGYKLNKDPNINFDKIESQVKYVKTIKRFVKNNVDVLFKWVPDRAEKEAWDLDWVLVALSELDCYVKPYRDARMHNGEVIYLLSKKKFPDALKFDKSFARRELAIAKHRMRFGNACRNLLLHVGLPVINNVPVISRFAMRFHKIKYQVSNVVASSSYMENVSSYSEAHNATTEDSMLALRNAQKEEREKKKLEAAKVKSDSPDETANHYAKQEKFKSAVNSDVTRQQSLAKKRSALDRLGRL